MRSCERVSLCSLIWKGGFFLEGFCMESTSVGGLYIDLLGEKLHLHVAERKE